MNFKAHSEALKASFASLVAEYPELLEDAQLRADMFEGETDIQWLLNSLVNETLDAETMVEAITIRASDMAERKKRFDNKSTSLRALISSIMEAAALPKIQLVDATLSVRQLAPSPIVTDETLLPENYIKIIRKPDMAAIKAAMEATSELPGVVMSNGKTSLTIRTK
jgi:Siphovirus Gp157